VLRNALSLSKGKYTTSIAAKLAKRLIELKPSGRSRNRYLTDLHTKDPAIVELFHELAKVYVRKSRAGTCCKRHLRKRSRG